MSWKTEYLFTDGKWYTNSVVLATKEEAEAEGQSRLMRWFVPTDSRAVESNDPVNYRFNFDTGRCEPIA